MLFTCTHIPLRSHTYIMDPKQCHQTIQEKKLNMENKSIRGGGEETSTMSEPSTQAPPPSPTSTSTTINGGMMTSSSSSSPPPSSSSSSSSPSHDFTFTISLYPSPSKSPNRCPAKSRNAIDLAPADDIFSHGHLLPLHLLTRPPFSPRRSTNTSDNSITISFNKTAATSIDGDEPSIEETAAITSTPLDSKEIGVKTTSSKSFPSILAGLARVDKDKDKKKDSCGKKKKFDMMKMVKRYASLVEALFFSRRSAKDKRRDLRQRPHSFSGVSTSWSRGGGRGGGGGAGAVVEDDYWRRRGKKRWGEFSAPASMRTSPTNSGLLVAPSHSLGSSEESTMEELQSAIEAAIAHCKNSMNNSIKGGAGAGGEELQVVVDN